MVHLKSGLPLQPASCSKKRIAAAASIIRMILCDWPLQSVISSFLAMSWALGCPRGLGRPRPRGAEAPAGRSGAGGGGGVARHRDRRRRPHGHWPRRAPVLAPAVAQLLWLPWQSCRSQLGRLLPKAPSAVLLPQRPPRPRRRARSRHKHASFATIGSHY